MRNRLFGLLFVCTAFLTGCSALTPNKAGLQVISSDIPAEVFLDGTKLGATPYVNRELKSGEYTLELKPIDSSFVSYQTKVSLKKQLLTVLTWKPGNRPETSGGVLYEMESLRNKNNSELSITTVPDGAIITVDEAAKGFAPVLTENITAGEHQFEVRLPSYETQQHTINVQQGYRMNVTVKLAKQEYQATMSGELASPSATLTSTASASISGKTVAKTDTKSAATSPTPTPKAKTASASATPFVLAVPKPYVLIKKTGYLEKGVEGVRIRNRASADGDQIGFAPTGESYEYLGQEFDGFYKISFEEQTAWVSSSYAELNQ